MLAPYTLSFRRLPAPAMIVLAFAATAAAGTGLLLLPWATREPIGVVEALFMATSAVTVTGLTVVDTGSRFTTLGHVTLLALMQAGGIGIITSSILVAMLIGRRIMFSERLRLMQAFGLETTGGLIGLVRRVAIFVLSIEAVGAALLAAIWWDDLAERAIPYAIFHAIAAFNNAGFSLWPDSLNRFAGDPLTNAVVFVLFVAGGVGFIVLDELARRRRLSLHSKIVLSASAVLIAVPAVLIGALEWNNPRTLGGMEPRDRVIAAIFESGSSRTAGFTTFDVGATSHAVTVVIMALMYIGASPVSTGGGIKTTTATALVLSALSQVRGRGEAQVFGRRIANSLVIRGGAIALFYAALLATATTVLAALEPAIPLPDLAFEATSALGTVGYTRGITSSLGDPARVLVTLLMFLGRVGPLTASSALAGARQRDAGSRYPEEGILVG